jgi:hypothetical protein
MQEFSRALPATAALEVFTKAALCLDASEKNKNENKKFGWQNHGGSLDLSSMFRAVVASDDAAFEFPEIGWPCDWNDGHANTLDSNNKNKILGFDTPDASSSLPPTPHKGKKRNQDFDEHYCEHLPFENPAATSMMRRAKTLRTELAGMSTSREESDRFGTLQKRYISDGQLLVRCNDFDRKHPSLTDFRTKLPDVTSSKDLHLALLKDFPVTESQLAPAAAALSEFLESARHFDSDRINRSVTEWDLVKDISYLSNFVTSGHIKDDLVDKQVCDLAHDSAALSDLIREVGC